jgi:anti-anti-sigma regulatory factor
LISRLDAAPGEADMNAAQLPVQPLVIRMDGTFDVPAAQHVARALADASTELQVRIDLTHVRDFHDFGVAVLAQALAARRQRVDVRGLRQHQVRLLRYLGIETGGDPVAVAAG